MKKKEDLRSYTTAQLKKMKSETDWDRINNMKDEDIDLSDDPELPASAWENATIHYPEDKTEFLHMRIKPYVKKYFQTHYKRYTTYLHEVIEQQMKKEIKKEMKSHK